MDAKAKCYCFTIQCELISEITGVDCSYEIPDILWYRIVPLLLTIPHKKKKKVGRPRMNDRQAMSAIFYILRTGCQWNALPRSLGAQVQYMTDFRNGGRLVYSSVCGLMVC